MAPPKTVRCPACSTPVLWFEASRFRPFCSERCRMMDLGDWAAERHRIAGDPLADTPDSDGARSEDGELN
jgi:endogenous inhibitor of DNA gyrase (YacG/DUF329 family)